MKKILLTFLITTSFLYSAGDCEVQENAQTKAQVLYEEALNLFEQQKYDLAYDKLQESIRIYPNMNQNKVDVVSICTYYVASAYAPVIKKERQVETKEFARLELGKNIKKYLNPNPYLFIQLKKDSTKVTVVNTPKTVRREIKKQSPLDDFKVSINGETLSFGTIKSKESKTLALNHPVSINNLSVQTYERYGFTLFNKADISRSSTTTANYSSSTTKRNPTAPKDKLSEKF